MLKPAQLYENRLQDGKLHDCISFEILAAEFVRKNKKQKNRIKVSDTIDAYRNIEGTLIRHEVDI